MWGERWGRVPRNDNTMRQRGLLGDAGHHHLMNNERRYTSGIAIRQGTARLQHNAVRLKTCLRVLAALLWEWGCSPTAPPAASLLLLLLLEQVRRLFGGLEGRRRRWGGHLGDGLPKEEISERAGQRDVASSRTPSRCDVRWQQQEENLATAAAVIGVFPPRAREESPCVCVCVCALCY